MGTHSFPQIFHDKIHDKKSYKLYLYGTICTSKNAKQKSRKPLILLENQRIYSSNQKKQITGVEPAFPAWEASVLPMNHICNKIIILFFRKSISSVFQNAGDRNRTGTMLPPQDFKSCASASSATPAQMGPTGLEPVTLCL